MDKHSGRWYAPFRIPAKWGEEERSLVRQIQDLFDRVFGKFLSRDKQDLTAAQKAQVIENIGLSKQDVSSKIALSMTNATFSQYSAYRIGSLVILSFVLTPSVQLNASTDYTITMTISDPNLRPLFRSNVGGSNIGGMHKVNAIPGSGTTDSISFQCTANISASGAFWLTTGYVCKY